ncbi:ATP-binding protein [Micromonosporaceae bacterium Da 78-11]
MDQATGVRAHPGGRGRRWRRRSALVLILVAAIGMTGTTLAAVALRHAEQDRQARALDQQTAIAAQVITAEVHRYATSLTDIAAAVGAQSQLQSAEFTAIAAPIDRERLPGATGVVLVVPAAADDVAATEGFWRARGNPQLKLRPAPGITMHRFVVLSRSIDSDDTIVGLDVAAADEAVDVMSTAEQSHQVATSRSYRLLRDRDAGVPVGQQQMSFSLAAPVYATSPDAPDAGRFRGWLMMGLRGRDFLHEAIAAAVHDTVDVSLADMSSGTPLEVARWEPAAAVATGGGTRTVSIAAPQRTWQLTVQPTEHLLPAAPVDLQWGAWLGGAVITVLLTALTATLLHSRDRAVRRVHEATAALRDDIARREAVEQQLRQREAELVGFAGIVAHDLRNPLARVLGYADFLREEAADTLDDMQRDFLERLYSGAKRMQVLIDDLLDYATADNRDIAHVAVDLRELAAEVIRERIEGGPQPPTVVAGALPVIEGDPTLLRQVLDNLVGNALKYTRPGQEPYVRLSSTLTPGGWWLIEVADRGIGIPEEERDGIFAAFTRAGGSESYPGTGLGLAIVHRIIERHRGEVGVRANGDGGSTFWFTVPCDLPDVPAATTIELSSSSSSSSSTTTAR